MGNILRSLSLGGTVGTGIGLWRHPEWLPWPPNAVLTPSRSTSFEKTGMTRSELPNGSSH